MISQTAEIACESGEGGGGRRKGCGKGHALFIKDSDHARRERVVGYLWDLQELVAVY
jgi:hypothetical protein